MKLLNCSNTARKVTVEVNILRVNYISNSYFCRRFLRTFIYATRNSDVRVLVNNPSSQVLACSINFFYATRHFQAFAKTRNLSVDHIDIGFLDDTSIFIRPDRRITHDEGFTFRQDKRPIRSKWLWQLRQGRNL